MASSIPAMTDTERWVVTQAVKERFGKEVLIEDVETEIRMHIDHRELTLCPSFYWLERGCHFVLSKTGEYDDIGDCVTTLMKMQADEEAKRLAEPPTTNDF